MSVLKVPEVSEGSVTSLKSPPITIWSVSVLVTLIMLASCVVRSDRVFDRCTTIMWNV